MTRRRHPVFEKPAISFRASELVILALIGILFYYVLKGSNSIKAKVVPPMIDAKSTLIESNQQLNQIRRLEASKVPTNSSSYQWSVTTSVKEFKLDNPWVSFSLINDGPGNVRIRINEMEGDITREATVNSGETISRNYTYPVVKSIFLVATAASTVRIFAEEGRWQ